MDLNLKPALQATDLAFPMVKTSALFGNMWKAMPTAAPIVALVNLALARELVDLDEDGQHFRCSLLGLSELKRLGVKVSS